MRGGRWLVGGSLAWSLGVLAVAPWPQAECVSWAVVRTAELVAQVNGPSIDGEAALPDGRRGTFSIGFGSPWTAEPGEIICVDVLTRWRWGQVILRPLADADCAALKPP